MIGSAHSGAMSSSASISLSSVRVELPRLVRLTIRYGATIGIPWTSGTARGNTRGGYPYRKARAPIEHLRHALLLISLAEKGRQEDKVLDNEAAVAKADGQASPLYLNTDDKRCTSGSRRRFPRKPVFQ